MIFGVVIASLAGFLLTAVPNWTGRLPLRGGALFALASLWLVGRAATLLALEIGPVAASVIDLAFLPVLLAVIVREIVAGQNWRNLPITIAVGLLFAANLLIHLEVLEMFETGGQGLWLAIATMIMLIGLVSDPGFCAELAGQTRRRASARAFWAFRRGRSGAATVRPRWMDRRAGSAFGWLGARGGWSYGRLAARTSAVRRYAFRALGLEPSSRVSVGAGWPVPLGSIIDHAGYARGCWPACIGRGCDGINDLGGDEPSHLGAHRTRPRCRRVDRCPLYNYLLAASATAAHIIAAFAPGTQPALLWLWIALWMAAFAIFTLRYGRLILVT